MKECPVCKSKLVDTAEVCYNCATNILSEEDIDRKKEEYQKGEVKRGTILREQSGELQILEKIYYDVHFIKSVVMAGIILVIILLIIFLFYFMLK